MPTPAARPAVPARAIFGVNDPSWGLADISVTCVRDQMWTGQQPDV